MNGFHGRKCRRTLVPLASTSSSTSSARLVHWNIRRCVDPVTSELSASRVLACVQRLNPTFLTLNEVDTTKSETLLDDFAAIGLRHQTFFGHVRGGAYGNALLSTVPLHDVEHTHLDGGSVVLTRSGQKHRIARGLLSASASVLGCEVRIAAP